MDIAEIGHYPRRRRYSPDAESRSNSNAPFPPDFSRRWSGGVGLFAINSSDPSGQPTRASSLVIATPGCAGLRPACLPSHGKCPLGRQPSRPAAPPPPRKRPAKVRQKSGPEARAPREPRLTCRGASRTTPTNLVDDAPQSTQGVGWVMASPPQRGGAYQPRVKPWVFVETPVRRSEGTPHQGSSTTYPPSEGMQRSFRTLRPWPLQSQGVALGW